MNKREMGIEYIEPCVRDDRDIATKEIEEYIMKNCRDKKASEDEDGERTRIKT